MNETPGGFAPVLAIYDFRSKQEFIYRTNRLQEISGASELIKDIYNRFFDELNKGKSLDSPPFLNLKDEGGKEVPFSLDSFKNNETILGQALYSGGGTLMMLYRSEEIYFLANKRISRMILNETQSLSMIAAHIPFDAAADFREQRTALYKKLSQCKSEIIPCLPCNVTPFTQISPSGHMPIAHKTYDGIDKELSRESWLKLQKNKTIKNNSTRLLDEAVFKKGEDSLLAIVYIDGNNMGEKLKACLDGCTDDIDGCVAALRQFSDDTEQAFVNDPYRVIAEWEENHMDSWLPGGTYKWPSRKVIGGGDEITFICTAGLALKLVQIYFEELKKKQDGNCFACAGIALFHSHAPFARVYEIAEECCENAKKKAREIRSATGQDGNYFDWYFCRSGLTNDMETIRETEEKGATGLPYAVDAFFERINSEVKPVFDKIGRSNVKTLVNAILSDSQGIDADSLNEKEAHASFLYETNRLNAYCGERLFKEDAYKNDAFRKLLFDAGSMCDVWFTYNQNYDAE